MTNPTDAWVNETTPAKRAQEWLVRSLARDADDDAAALDVATAQAFALLAIHDALTGIRAELGFIGNALAEDREP